MTAVWIAIGVLTVSCFAIKAAGPVVLGGRELPRGPQQLIVLLTAGATIADVQTTSIFLASGDERREEIARLRARQRPMLDDDRDAA